MLFLAIACPKLDEGQEIYLEKLRILIDEAEINTLTVMIMQVPCCSGLLALAEKAAEKAKQKANLQEKKMKSEKMDIKGKIFNYQNLVDFQEGTIVSSQILDQKKGSVTVFAFDAGQRLSEHTTPFDAMVQVVEGKGIFFIQGVEYTVSAGQVLIMPAGKPHAVQAKERFKMVLVMIRSGDGKKND